MSDGMTEVYRRRNAVERYKAAFNELYYESPNDWLQIVMKSVAFKLVKKAKSKKAKKSR